MSRLAGGMKGFVVLGVYRSTVKKQNKEKTLRCLCCCVGIHNMERTALGKELALVCITVLKKTG